MNERQPLKRQGAWQASLQSNALMPRNRLKNKKNARAEERASSPCGMTTRMRDGHSCFALPPSKTKAKDMATTSE